MLVENVLDNTKVEIIAYVDNDKSKWDEKRNNLEIINPNKIKDYNYDYIIIGSQFNEEIYNQLLSLEINKNIILQYSYFLDNCRNYIKEEINGLISNSDYVPKVVTTGISYAFLGFIEKIFCKKVIKLAYGSQDLFFDYHIVKFILEEYPDKASAFEHAIIGLCYYSFEYDMSLSAMKGKIVLYYDVLKKSHHFKDIERVYEDYQINNEIADEILRKCADGNYDFKWDVPKLTNYENKEIMGKRQAEIDCNKNYPQTVKENIQIFKDYLQLLKDHNIRPIVVVYPATKYYTGHFSKRIEDEFHSIINEVRKQYDFQYIDYFRSDLFNDDDFVDVSHLNCEGAKKFTEILNDEIDF